MKNKKVLIIAISLILVFAAVLSVCMYTVSKRNVKEKNISDEEVSGVDNSPMSQEELKKKFAQFNHEESGNTLRLFSAEQLAESLEKAANGERFCLTEQEAMFIIDDTVALYDKYDTIILDGWSKLPFVIEEAEDKKKFQGIDEEIPAIKTVECYHGDFSEYLYKDAEEAYGEMILDIYDIISYRFALHDSRFATAYYDDSEYSGRQTTGRKFTFDKNELLGELYTVAHDTCRILMTDGGNIDTDEEHRSYITNVLDYTLEYYDIADDIKTIKSEYPIFFMCSQKRIDRNIKNDRYGYLIEDGIRIYTSSDKYETVFPTASLKARRPEMCLDTSCFGNKNIHAIHIEQAGVNIDSISINTDEFLRELGDMEKLLAKAEPCEDLEKGMERLTFSVYVDTITNTSIVIRPDGLAYFHQSRQKDGEQQEKYYYINQDDETNLDGYLRYVENASRHSLAKVFEQGVSDVPTALAEVKYSTAEDLASLFISTKRLDRELVEGENYKNVIRSYGVPYVDPEDSSRLMYYGEYSQGVSFTVEDDKICDISYRTVHEIGFVRVAGAENGYVKLADTNGNEFLADISDDIKISGSYGVAVRSGSSIIDNPLCPVQNIKLYKDWTE